MLRSTTRAGGERSETSARWTAKGRSTDRRGCIVPAPTARCRFEETADPSGKKWAKRGAIAGGLVGLIFRLSTSPAGARRRRRRYLCKVRDNGSGDALKAVG